jgi:SPP1 family predicted phage head-tail adaptor
MQSGRLDHVLELQRATTSVGDAGEPIEAWTTYATVRAERLKASVDEQQRGWGASNEVTVRWRIRWHDDVQVGDRITLNGIPHDIKHVEPIGRHRELQITTLFRK